MGALHAGHLALVAMAREHADRVVVSIFVNPTQFAPHEDLANYPRQEAEDLARLGRLSVDAAFVPTVDDIYPAGFATTVSLSGPAEGLESDHRPHFFAGVATVVARLLIGCQPDVAIFGEKDYQQLMVIRRLVADLAIPVEIIGHPVVREADGLACSSRNVYLSPAERAVAPALSRGLSLAADRLRQGASREAALSAAGEAIEAAGFTIDYLVLRNTETLAEITDPDRESARLLVAARLGATRLIDNIPV
jgi:pantoate--beta-alanine ligase